MSSVLVHRPAPRAVTFASMVFLAAIVLPAFFLGPTPPLDAGLVFGLGVFVAFELVLFGIAQRRVEVCVAGPNLRLVNAGFPLPERSWEVPLRDIERAELERAPRSKAMRLVLQNKTAVPLTSSYFGRSAQQDRDLEALRALIASSR